jgi:hypothetical protein
MFGTFQKSEIRIEIDATSNQIGESLLNPDKMRLWLWPQQFSPDLPPKFTEGLTFNSNLGLITIQHQVKKVDDHCLLMILSQGIDGYHEWYWGDHWVQSRIEGISLLPLNIAQIFSLLRLRQWLKQHQSIK